MNAGGWIWLVAAGLLMGSRAQAQYDHQCRPPSCHDSHGPVRVYQPPIVPAAYYQNHRQLADMLGDLPHPPTYLTQFPPIEYYTYNLFGESRTDLTQDDPAREKCVGEALNLIGSVLNQNPKLGGCLKSFPVGRVRFQVLTVESSYAKGVPVALDYGRENISGHWDGVIYFRAKSLRKDDGRTLCIAPDAVAFQKFCNEKKWTLQK
jgi:hypothetical protein